MDPYREKDGGADDGKKDTEKLDKYKELFKKYKNCKNHEKFLEFEEIFDRDHPDRISSKTFFRRNVGAHVVSSDGSISTRASSQIDNQHHTSCSTLFGLTHPSTWEVYEFEFPKGLIFIKNPFTALGQRYWISKCLTDYPKEPHITNMENLRRRNNSDLASKDSSWSQIEHPNQFYKELRWITFGYHHDWDTKVYSEDNRCDFPQDLGELTRYLSLVLGYKDFTAEAAIVNYYHMDSTLSGHVDKSEKNQFAPLFSLSFGQTALFLIGADTKDRTPLPLYLKSGDIAVMAGTSRLSYHGVPKILPSIVQPWFDSDSEFSTATRPGSVSPHAHKKLKLDEEQKTCDCIPCNFVSRTSFNESNPAVQDVLSHWSDWHASYISKSRINLNVRQVLFPGQKSLNDNVQVES